MTTSGSSGGAALGGPTENFLKNSEGGLLQEMVNNGVGRGREVWARSLDEKYGDVWSHRTICVATR